jgi:hypothetical protein
MPPLSHILLYSVSGGCVLATCVLTMVLGCRHLQNWADPVGQRLTLRVVALLPIYSLCSLASLLLPRLFIYFDSVRELYEAYVLHQFVLLMLHYFYRRAPAHFGLRNALRYEEKCHDSEVFASENLEELFTECEPVVMCCGWLVVEAGPRTLATLRYTVLQYLVMRTLFTVVAVPVHESGLYHHRDLDPSYAYFWLTALLTLSICAAVGAMLLLLGFVKKVVWAHDPTLKFLSLKLVICLIFWQSLLFNGLVYADMIPTLYFVPWSATEVVGALDNLLICVEMAFLSLYHQWIFRYDETQRASPLRESV